jgi:two-component system, chemotaxis family, sensor kinase Cph1
MRHELQFDASFQANDAVDVPGCESEPIHIPGMIQPHGLLLILEDADLIIRQVSDNSVEMINIRPGDLVDHPLDEILGIDQSARLRMILQADDLILANPLKPRLPDRPEARVQHPGPQG